MRFVLIATAALHVWNVASLLWRLGSYWLKDQKGLCFAFNYPPE
jgi:hypothetical protein